MGQPAMSVSSDLTLFNLTEVMTYLYCVVDRSVNCAEPGSVEPDEPVTDTLPTIPLLNVPHKDGFVIHFSKYRRVNDLWGFLHMNKNAGKMSE